MSALMMHGQNCFILFAVMHHFSIRESSPLTSVTSRFLRYASGFGGLGILIKYWGTWRLLGLAASGTRSSSSKGMPRSKLLLVSSSIFKPSFGVGGKSML
jgi:hypothetical protein